MSGPYREGACAGCGNGRPVSDAVGLCADCLRDTMARARRIVDGLGAGPGRAQRWARAGALASFALLGVIAWNAASVLRSRSSAREPSTDDAVPQTREAAPHRLARAAPGEPWSDAAAARPPRPLELRAGPPPRLEFERDPRSRSLGPEATAPLPWPPHLLANAGPPTHEPGVLLERARRLASAGLELAVVDMWLGPRRAPFRAFAIEPFTHAGAGPIGVRVLGGDPATAEIGLAPDDVLTAVNGWPVERDSDAWARPFLAPSGLAVLEVLRERRRVVVALRWSPGAT